MIEYLKHFFCFCKNQAMEQRRTEKKQKQRTAINDKRNIIEG